MAYVSAWSGFLLELLQWSAPSHLNTNIEHVVLKQDCLFSGHETRQTSLGIYVFYSILWLNTALVVLAHKQHIRLPTKGFGRQTAESQSSRWRYSTYSCPSSSFAKDSLLPRLLKGQWRTAVISATPNPDYHWHHSLWDRYQQLQPANAKKEL